jgi:hypothetical protein
MVIAFCKQMAIHFAHPFMPKGPRIELLVLESASANLQFVGMPWVPRTLGFKHPRVMRRLHQEAFAIEDQFNGFGFGNPSSYNPLTRLELLGPEKREGMIVSAFSQPLAVLNHPVENSAGHAGGWTSLARELKRKTCPGSTDFPEFLGSDQILREVHVDDPALSIENDK